ncbi:MAG TPA: L-histidine N(alpha)-methyltransferase [Oleiagrimonas sp.]|nr:L-histidine N(alpha)-methyltransferase [Oleiagrimonas sp.]
MRADVLAALRRRPRRLSSKYFYDAEGSALFEQICRQPEYYLTRAELALMRAHVDAIARSVGPDALLVEYGSGSGIKTRMLLEHLQSPVAYTPVEISRTALAASVDRLREDFPDIEMLPVCADFTRPLVLPEPRRRPRRRVIYFPGSTIGNFESHAAIDLLRHMHAEMGDHGAALVGVDLVKDPAVLEAAYNDAAGITARFTLNMLAHFNRALDADFDLDAFAHHAHYNPMAERIETSIVSQRDQDVQVAGEGFHFDAEESLQVEYSCKYSQASFARLVAHAGLRVVDTWTDPEGLFSVQLLERD